MALHQKLGAGFIHPVSNWVVADATARLALVPVAGDAGKVAWQQSDNTLWLLTNHVGPVWVGATGGGGVAAYVHSQGSAATAWTIAHNLGVRPAIELLDTGGAEIDAEVIHLSVNTAQALFTQAIAGTARCL